MKYLRILLMALTATALAACGGSDDAASPGTATKGTLSLKLTDAPASDYKEVWVTIDEVRIHRSETAEEGDGGWETLETGEGAPLPLKVDLLKLRNGVLAGLGDIQLDEGRYTQMRLVLGGDPGDNYVVVQVDENTTATHELTTPSAQRSGLKLNHPFDVVGGETLELVLDFDAARSVVKAGNSGKYLLKPVIAVIPTVVGSDVVNAEVAGAFTADDLALAAGASVSLQSVADGKVLIVREGVVEGDGTWELTPVPPGENYNLVVVKPGFRTMVISGVSVAEGDVLAVPSFPLFALGADDAEIALNTGTVDGTVDPAAAVAVQALQALGGGNVVEVAHVGVAEGEGVFAMSLPVPAPLVAPYVAGEAPEFSPLGDPAPYDFVAVGSIGDVPVAGAVTGVTLTGGETTPVEILLTDVL